MRRLYFIFITLACASTWTFAQTDESWREATQEVKDSINAIGMSEYASNKAKLREPIDNEVERINASDLDSTYIDFPQLSTEGGELHVYRENGEIVKIDVSLYGCSQQAHISFYVKNGELFSLEETNTKYNAPITADEFSLEDSKEDHILAIFRDRKLIDYQVRGDCGAPWEEEFIASESAKYISMYDTCMDAIEASTSESQE